MAAAHHQTVVRVHRLAGNLRRALIRREIIGMISVCQTSPESNFLNNRRGSGAAPGFSVMDGGAGGVAAAASGGRRRVTLIKVVM